MRTLKNIDKLVSTAAWIVAVALAVKPAWICLHSLVAPVLQFLTQSGFDQVHHLQAALSTMV